MGFAAHAHLSSPRADGPFVVVDATERETHDLALWKDEARSPLVAADGGSLLILAAAALPREVQEHLGQVLRVRSRQREQPSHSSVPAAGLLFSLPTSIANLEATDRWHEALARELRGREVVLPGLVDRAEDLRALVLEALSRFGIATSGEPLGIEPAALAALAEHEFPGNELELFGLIARTAAHAPGPRITLPDLKQGGLGTPARERDEARHDDEDDSGHTPPPSLAIRRRSLRRAGR
jgi:DNA-binding NtrC family response regulator